MQVFSAWWAGRGWRMAAAALVVAVAGGVSAWIHQQRIAGRLLRADPATLLGDPALRSEAVDLGLPVYRKHCAACHGAELQGNRARGVPDLAGGAWLYASDPVAVEQTILYGIRSGHPRSRNVTDMPALVRSGQVTAADAEDAVEFVESLAGARYDKDKALRGRALYVGKGNCIDCHAADAHGVSDYGAPALTGPSWLYGGDRSALYSSIVDGRHGVCPAWVRRLTPLEIRAVTLYLVSAAPGLERAHPATQEAP